MKYNGEEVVILDVTYTEITQSDSTILIPIQYKIGDIGLYWSTYVTPQELKWHNTKG